MINNKQLKKDMKSTMTNEEIVKKYGFKSNRDFLDYASKNNLFDKPKPMTKEEKKNLEETSKFLKKCLGELQ